MTKRSVTHDTFVIERVYGAQPSRVFAALSDPAEKVRWFNGPEEWGPDEYSMDFREGGLEFSRGGPESGAYLDGFDKPGMREQGTAELLDALGAYLVGTPAKPAAAPAGR